MVMAFHVKMFVVDNKKAPKGADLLELKNVSRHVQHIGYFAVILLLL